MSDFTHDVTGISALADDFRRELYLFVVSQPAPVGRDQAAKALGVPPHQAKFHLDRLEEAGLLESEYVRLTGRSGPGAGRPAKIYRRVAQEVSVSLPGREYELAGEVMATAIDDSADHGTPIAEALAHAARERGRHIGTSAGNGTPLELAAQSLSDLGYEPRVEGDRVVMGNCPFRALAKDHPRLVCGMNLALLSGLSDQLGGLTTTLDPGAGRCCVTLKAG
jgi:predicted ArsR family transcriptional regulator